jgi:hypothetical protein
MAKIPGVNDPIPGRPDDPLTWPGMAIKGRSTGFDSHLASDRNRRVAARCPASGRTTLDRTGSGHSARRREPGLMPPCSHSKLSFVAPPLVSRGVRDGAWRCFSRKMHGLAPHSSSGSGRESITVWAHLLSLGHRARIRRSGDLYSSISSNLWVAEENTCLRR